MNDKEKPPAWAVSLCLVKIDKKNGDTLCIDTKIESENE